MRRHFGRRESDRSIYSRIVQRRKTGKLPRASAREKRPANRLDASSEYSWLSRSSSSKANSQAAYSQTGSSSIANIIVLLVHGLVHFFCSPTRRFDSLVISCSNLRAASSQIHRSRISRTSLTETRANSRLAIGQKLEVHDVRQSRGKLLNMGNRIENHIDRCIDDAGHNDSGHSELSSQCLLPHPLPRPETNNEYGRQPCDGPAQSVPSFEIDQVMCPTQEHDCHTDQYGRQETGNRCRCTPR